MKSHLNFAQKTAAKILTFPAEKQDEIVQHIVEFIKDTREGELIDIQAKEKNAIMEKERFDKKMG